MFILFLSFSSSFACVAKVSDWPKCQSLNDEPCKVKPTLIDWNPIELKYYPWLVSINVLQVVMPDHQRQVFQKKQNT